MLRRVVESWSRALGLGESDRQSSTTIQCRPKWARKGEVMRTFFCLLFCFAITSVAMGQDKMAVANYDVSGSDTNGNSFSGTGTVSSQGDSATTTINTPSWGIDDYEWDKTEKMYKITDGETGKFLGWLKCTKIENTNNYTSNYYATPGTTPTYTGTWKKS